METMSYLARVSCLFGLLVISADAADVRVTSVVLAPFLERTSEGQYKGYIVEMLDLVEKRMNDTTFNILTVDDYGTAFENGSWSGMVGQLLRNEADVAAAPLTVNEERKMVIDFTVPFLNFSLVILVKRGSPAESFQSVSDLLASDIEYGALADGSTERLFSTAGDSDPDKVEMWKVMTKQENRVRTTEDGVKRVREQNGQYALVVESLTASYHAMKQPCDLVQVDIKLNSPNTYALATQKGSVLLPKLNKAMGSLIASGELEKLRGKHWQNECGTSRSDQPRATMATLLAAMSVFIFLSHDFQL